MCAQFLIKAAVRDIELQFGPFIENDWSSAEQLDIRVVPYRRAPAVVAGPSGRILRSMNYSLIPSWSKEPKVRFATHNARLDTILEKPTWRKPFTKHRCLIPLTHFVEPIYLHQYAGNMVAFSPSQPHLLAAAGLYDQWVHMQTGEVLFSCAIITDAPPTFVAATGHDRCPVFIQESAYEQWLNPQEHQVGFLQNLLHESRSSIDFVAAVDRPMRPGWEKRIPK